MNTPTLKTRREFLRHGMTGASLAWTIPAFLGKTMDLLAASALPGTADDAKILVVLQMAGGNDGLNTITPISNDHYQRARPRLALKPGDLLKANDAWGFHPALKGFKDLWDQGCLSVIQGVGYPNPNRSHFRSTEIWQTASDSNRFATHGWLGRFFDHQCQGCPATIGVHLGREAPQAFAGPRPLGISMESPERFRFAPLESARDEGSTGEEKTYRELIAEDAMEGMPSSGQSIGSLPGANASGLQPLDFIQRTALDAQAGSDAINAVLRKGKPGEAYPSSKLAQSLQLVARLITGGLATRVYYVSQGGYDTHTQQSGAHARLLGDLGDSLRAFVGDLRKQGSLDRVLIMTFSEFGRRVAENANGGTDHGAAAPMFLAGTSLRPGFHGSAPSLEPAKLERGDLKFTVDFRSVYASILSHWLKAPPAAVLGRKFDPLDFLKS
ncbi:MAG: DUF1501 domain-containing protein [Verrucomicrobia bacterium]|nr:DUF1501 domain-containing protein [Verrucomicrobiota bacterium]